MVRNGGFIMDRETLRNMDQNKYRDMLEVAAFDEIETMLNISKGHCREMHEGLTDEDMLNRMIKEEKENVSSFWDKESVEDGISNVIAYRTKEITEWLFKERYEFKQPKDYQMLCIEADIGGESVGHGFVKNGNNFSEKETSAVRIILQRDMDGESPFGFYIKTAYTDIEHKNAIETGLSLSKEELLKNPDISFNSSMHQLYFAINDKYKNVNIYQRTNSDTREPYIKLIFPETEKGRIEAFITEKDYSLKLIHLDKSRKIDFSECFFQFPEESKIISDIKNMQNILKERNRELGISFSQCTYAR